MIPAYSPQARGRCERNFGTWQGRLPQELRLAGIQTIEQANQFLRKRYIVEFNARFAVAARQRGTAFRKTSRADLDWIFSVQSERVVARDNTIAFGDQTWQLEKTRWRYSLAGCRVMVHEHLDGRLSVRYAPRVVASWRWPLGSIGDQPEHPGKAGADGSLEISPTARDSHFPTAPTTRHTQKRQKTKAA